MKKNLLSERFQISKWNNYFDLMFEDVRLERSLKIILSLTDRNIPKQSKFTDDEITIIWNLAPEKLYRQRILKEHAAMDLL